jgi:hypothetical protein
MPENPSERFIINGRLSQREDNGQKQRPQMTITSEFSRSKTTAERTVSRAGIQSASKDAILSDQRRAVPMNKKR